MTDTSECKREVADRISQHGGVEIGPEHIEVKENGDAVLTEAGAEKMDQARGREPGRLDSLLGRLSFHPTTGRAIVGYTAALAFGGYAARFAVGGEPAAAILPMLLALLGASLGRYYHTARSV